MPQKKIFVLLPDGVGLRNFAFTSFVETGNNLSFEILFWNMTTFNLKKLGFSEKKLVGKSRTKTDILKRAKIESELNLFKKRFNDEVYQTYKFPPSSNGFRHKIKNNLVRRLVKETKDEKELQELRCRIKRSERNSSFYRECKKVLKDERPDFIFCTNQRPVNAIAPLLAAKDLNIPTATMIFSWDNLPKATMVIEPDYYFVWSKHMAQELLNYYPYINSEQIHVTGTPQFEPHFNKSLLKNRSQFFEEHNLDPHKKYICFSGNDQTTSPDDPQYLEDFAKSIECLNRDEHNLGIIFRRCPTDFSSRYRLVLEKYKHVISPIDPLWEKEGDSWNKILPSPKDMEIQMNTIAHSEAVVNIGSSMVFDYAAFNKPCLYLNYDVEEPIRKDWSCRKIYNFIHFRSMPSTDSVLWINSKDEIGEKVKKALGDAKEVVNGAKMWFEKINLHPPQKGSERIWNKIDGILHNAL